MKAARFEDAEFFAAWFALLPGVMLVCALVGHFYRPAFDLVHTYPRLSALADGVVSGVLAWYWAWYWAHRRHVYTSYDGQRYVLDSNRKPIWIDDGDPRNK
jgi:hypothetical protein